MDDEKVMRDSSILAGDMEKMLFKKFKNKNIEYIFKFGTCTLFSLLCGFVDSILKNNNFDQKLKLVDEICNMTKTALKSKQEIIKGKKSETH